MASGTDARLLGELYRRHKDSPFLLLPHARSRHESFIVRHFAEDVTYTATGGFTLKNDSTVRASAARLLHVDVPPPRLS